MRYVRMNSRNNNAIVCSRAVLVIAILAFNLFGMSIIGGLQTALAGDSDSSQEWVSVFNGKDLTSWDGDSRLWSVKDGVIRGQTTIANPAPGNTFLIWRGGKLRDFELKIKFRIQNGNSGIQYRSKEIDQWVVSGYQAEVENNPGKVGFLYHEAGRGWLVKVRGLMGIGGKGMKEGVGHVLAI